MGKEARRVGCVIEGTGVIDYFWFVDFANDNRLVAI